MRILRVINLEDILVVFHTQERSLIIRLNKLKIRR